MVEYFYSDIKNDETIMASEPACQYGYVCSPMNYIGGKYKLLPQLMPKNIRTFVDLFCGGCNVGINAHAQKVIFNDNLSYLIDLYKTFNILDSNEVISHIESRISQYNLSLTNEEGYKELRKLYNSQRNHIPSELKFFSFHDHCNFYLSLPISFFFKKICSTTYVKNI